MLISLAGLMGCVHNGAEIHAGMTEGQVRASWGKPVKVQTVAGQKVLTYWNYGEDLVTIGPDGRAVKIDNVSGFLNEKE